MNQAAMIVVMVALAGFGVLFLSMYNRLVSLRNQLERAWSNIDVILKQRFDELPQVMRVIEQYAGYEAGLMTQLADARAHYGQARDVDEKIRAASELNLAFRGVAALAESYPELKANSSFLQLQTRVSELEDMIADRRESYNECVATFNARIEQFPDMLAARMLDYRRQNLFQVEEREKQQPALQMNLPKFQRPA